MRLPTRLLRRNPDANKGDFGHIFVLAGSPRFSGAAVLSAEAAMRAGAGLVTLGVPKGINNAIIRIKPKEVMTLPLTQTRQGNLSPKAFGEIKHFARNADILTIGPGLGREGSTQSLIRRLIMQIDKPMVIDADGLNAMMGHLRELRRRGQGLKVTVMTPHPGEMARLTGMSVAEIQKNREKVAKDFAKAHKVTLVLKGRGTVVADYLGREYINRTGNPGMATAGSGDVLSGIIAAFLGQGLDAFSAAKYGVYLHGLAGDLAAEEKTQLSLMASDIIGHMPEAIKRSS